MLRQCLIPIGATIVIGLLDLSAARFLIIFDLVLGNDQGLLIVARILAAFVPHYLAFMLPLAIYWGSYTVARKLTVGSEVNCLQATGSSIARTFSVLIALGVVFACIDVAVVGWLQPLGRYSYRALTYNLENSDFYLRVRAGTFTKVGQRTVFMEKIDRDRRSFEKIMIFEQGEKGSNMTILAPRGNLAKINGRLNLRLFDGQRLLIENMADPDNVQMMDFKVVDVPVGGATEPFRARGDDEQELLLPELMARDSPLADATLNDISTSLHKRLVIALSCLFLPLLAVALGVQSSRKKNLYQSVFALLLVIIYHQMVEFSGDIGKRISIGSAEMLWSVYALYFFISAWAFYRTAVGVGPLQDRVVLIFKKWAAPLDRFAWRRGRLQLP